jgi:hypothetical protein
MEAGLMKIDVLQLQNYRYNTINKMQFAILLQK